MMANTGEGTLVKLMFVVFGERTKPPLDIADITNG
jgi:hypothetical protein